MSAQEAIRYYMLAWFAINLLVVIFMNIGLDYGSVRSGLGLLNQVATFAMYGAPLIKMQWVIKNKNSAPIPPLLAMCNFGAACLWTMYSVMIEDYILLLPFSAGAIMGAMQLVHFT